MRKFRQFAALAMAALLTMGMSTAAMAASITINSTTTTGATATDTTTYTYYKILDADIEDASKITVNQDTGASTAAPTGEDVPKVAYYVDTEAKATALSGTGLFKVTKDATQAKWYVELKNKSTSAADIATALDGIKGTFAEDDNTFAQTTPGGTAVKEGLDPGYYLITSTLGDVLAVQTLADVTINTKNDYPSVDKTIPDTDKSAQIGDIITYTVPVTVPASANDQIVVTDTMTEGLTFDAIVSVTNSDGNVDYTSVPETLSGANVTGNGNKFTITFTAATVAANKGKTINIVYKAKLNDKAAVDVADEDDNDGSGNNNTVKLKYGNNYESVGKPVEVDTQQFSFDKYDASDSTMKLPGAVFELRLSGNALSLYEVTAGEVYRIATAEEITAGTNIVTSMTTAGKTITVKGVDGDVTYQLVETQAPTSYNLPTNPSTDVKPGTDNATLVGIENNKGTVLPSTGGMGTTIFYIVGAVLVLGAGILLVARKRMSE